MSLPLPLPVRLARRELRGGLRGFYIFLACLALGVMAISGVGSLSRALFDGLAREGQAILGGDAEFSLIHRQANGQERAFLVSHGRVSETATLRAMARADDPSNSDSASQTLAELKAVDDAYPLYGQVALAGGGDFQGALARDGESWGAVADGELLARLGIKTGSAIRIGEARFIVHDIIAREPDRLSAGLSFGPRILISSQALAATQLLRPGSLVRWHYRLQLPQDARGDGAIAALESAAKARFPDAEWRITNRNRASPRLATAIERLTQMLTLVGLTVLVVGGVGIANAVRAYLDAKRQVIATLKCLGAPARTIFWTYLVQIGVLALSGIAAGLAGGAILPLGAGYLLEGVLPLRAEAGIYPAPLLLAVAYGALTALAFSLWPLGRARDVPAAFLFRDLVTPAKSWPRAIYIVAITACIGVLVALAIATASEQRIAVIYTGAAAAAFVLLRFVGAGIMALARRLTNLRQPEVRLAIGNISRPGALTPSVVLSLGLGLTLLVALALIDGNMTRQLTSAIPEKAPSFFFVDIQRDETPGFASAVRKTAPDGQLQTVPMLRGRIISLAGVGSQDIKAPPNTRWALSGDRGITYADALPEGSRLVRGQWWSKDYSGEPLVSFEQELAEAFGLDIGDEIVVSVLGRQISARVANLRKVNWESLGINFVMVFSSNTFAGAPHMMLATLTLPEAAGDAGEIGVLKAVSAAFPQVTIVRVKDALETAGRIFSQIMWAIRGASSVTVIASIMVLAGALAAGHRGRIRDAVILKTLGATRLRLLAAFALEYSLLGLATALFAILAGAAAAYFVLTQVMNSDFVFMPSVAVGTAAGAAMLMIVLGLASSWSTLGEKPARVLRDL